MLNIHSFLPELHNKEGIKGCKFTVMIVSYVLIAVIIVLSSDNSYGHGAYAAEVYAESSAIQEPFELNHEEAAGFMQIQPDTDGPFVIAQLQQIASEHAKQEQLIKIREIETAKEEAEKRKKLEEEKKEQERKEKEKREQERKEKEKREQERKEKEKREQERREEEKKEQERKKAAEEKKAQFAQNEKEVLMRIVEAEATGQDVKGKMLVANVILNRVQNHAFPSTIEGVVFQKSGGTYQFSPIQDGRYYSVSISDTTRTAVDRALSGEDLSKGALYFMARRSADGGNVRWFDNRLTWLLQYGSHEFYK